MTYNTIDAMGQSQSLMSRVAACAAEEGNTNPRNWVGNNMVQLAARMTPEMQSAWETAAADRNGNPDVGRRDDVITDADILNAVQAIKANQGSDQGWITVPATTTTSTTTTP